MSVWVIPEAGGSAIEPVAGEWIAADGIQIYSQNDSRLALYKLAGQYSFIITCTDTTVSSNKRHSTFGGRVNAIAGDGLYGLWPISSSHEEYDYWFGRAVNGTSDVQCE